MAATELTTYRLRKKIEAISNSFIGYKDNAIPKFQALFSPTGTATGNDVIGLRARSLELRSEVATMVAEYDRTSLDAQWPAVTGYTPTNSRADLLDIRNALNDLRLHIRDNASALIVASVSDDVENIQYNSLTAVQRADILALINAIDALII